MPRRTGAPRPAWPTGSLIVLGCLLALMPPLLVADQLHHWGVSPFAVNETVGAWAAESLGMPAVGGLRAQDAGELTVWAGMGLIVVVVLWLTHRRSPRPARRDCSWLAVLVVVLMVFALGVDMLHTGVPAPSSSWRADHLTTWVEATGEVAAMAGLAAFAYGVARRELGGPAWSTWPQEPQGGAHTGAGASSADVLLQR